MLHTLYVALATFWAWETVRYAVAEYAPGVYSATRALQPLVVAVLPLVVLWPDWIRALAVAGLVGILHLIAARFAGSSEVSQVPVPRTRRGGLPPLP